MNFYFKVNYSSKIGLGHINRCLNIANCLQSYCSLTFLVIKNNLKNQNIIDKKKFKIIFFKNNDEILKKSKKIFKFNEFNFLIIDDYCTNYNWEKKIYKFVNKILVIDDFTNRRHYCDYYLNQNIFNQNKDLIANSNKTTLFLGGKYALLDKKYNFYFNIKRNHNSLKKILVSFGGTDTENYAEKILYLFKLNKNNKIHIVAIIPNSKKFILIKKKYAYYKNIKILNRTKSLAKTIFNSDFIIGSAGLSALERLCLFKPSLVFCLAKNQKIIFNDLKKKKLIIDGGNINKLNQNKFDDIINLAVSKYSKLKDNLEKNLIFVDGLGAKRISEIILNKERKNIVLRRAQKKDVYLYYNWFNDELVRKFSIKNKLIDFKTHKKWFINQLKSKKKNILYVMYLNNLPIGQIRINVENYVGKIDYSIDKDFRGKGFGHLIIKKLLDLIKKKNLKKL